jgi:opacity protein-like surface antigen
MGRVAIGLCSWIVLSSAALAGTLTYSNKNTQAVVPECPQWYADNEFNLNLSAVYAFTGNPWNEDIYLNVDHAWGGAIDAKYFLQRYFGFGLQATMLAVNSHERFDTGVVRIRGDEDRHAVGSVLGTFTFRFPIKCSRFAPYVWGGGGAIFGGGKDHDYALDPTVPSGVVRRDFGDSKTKSVAQVGGGLEVRLTPRLGWTNDFSWNVVSGSNNNFGLARTGFNFVF